MKRTDKLSTVSLTIILLVSFVGAAFAGLQLMPTAVAGTDGPTFSIVQITDTQKLAFLSPTLYNDTTSWIVNNAANYNVKMVVVTGDFVDAFVTNPPPPPIVAYNASQLAQEWSVANGAMSKLLNAGVPYCWAAGNHDQTPWANSSGTMIGNSYPAISAATMRSKPYWVSDLYDSKNTAVRFTVNNFPFMMINLEFLANSSARAWMKSLLDSNPSANIIVTTHGYLSATADHNNSNSAVATWNNALKAMLDSYPNVFLALSGHIAGWNMTRVGYREEILFDRQEANNGTGAASARIYTFNLTNKKVNASTYCVDKQVWLTDAYNQFTFDASIASDWTLSTDARAMKAYPDLKESIWQKEARMPPNGQYDKIGLHRLVKTGVTPKGVVLLTNCPTWGMGEGRISNPTTDSFTKYENSSQAIYLANRGFDVYGIDFRTHFGPKPLNASDATYAAGWGLDVWVSDIKEAAEKAKAVSGFSKLFISGECSGGTAALNYATKYWQTDLNGIIMLDPNYQAVASHPFIGTMNTTNTYNLTKALETMRSSNTWAMEDFPQSFKDLSWYALQNPGAPAVNPATNESLSPALNPLTNRTWANITEWYTAAAYNNFGAYPTMPGLYANSLSGYTDVSSLEYAISKSEWLPQRILLENQAMSDWTNCTYLNYDYDDHYKEIGVPVLIFTAQLFKNRTGTFRYVNGINSTLTGVMLKNYGHTDVFFGTYSARDVSQPALAWMLNELGFTPRATAFSNATVFPGWTWNFFVHSTAGAAPYTYQWYEGTSLLAGQTKMVLPVTKNAPGIYTYYCRVTDADGATASSNTVTLTVVS